MKKAIQLLLVLLTFSCATPSVAQEVYKTDTGEKYHQKKCRYLKYSRTKITLKKAIALGLTACKVCQPKKAAASHSSNVYLPSHTPDKPTSKQCTGKTQSGSRCKRKTKNSTGKCYQH